MRKPIDDDTDWNRIREHLELDDFPPVLSSTPPERYREISCAIPGFSTDLNRALRASQPQPQSQICWLNVVVWAAIAAVSALWMTGLIWFIQTIIQAIPI
jgi:hypothetical protein